MVVNNGGSVYNKSEFTYVSTYTHMITVNDGNFMYSTTSTTTYIHIAITLYSTQWAYTYPTK
jgi:hypothetical protein